MRRLALGLIILGVIAGNASARWQQPTVNLPENFVIGLHAAATVDPADYVAAAEAGFNIVLPARPGLAYSLEHLRACGAAGLKGVSWDPRLSTYGFGDRSSAFVAVRDYAREQALAGHVVCSNVTIPPARLPQYSFPLNQYIGSADRTNFRYAEAMHLKDFPDEAGYMRYLMQFIGAGPGFVVYEEDDPASTAAMRALQITSTQCAARQRTWWRRVRMDAPDAQTIRWQAYSAAAAGAQGIIYMVMRPIPGFRNDSLSDAEGDRQLFDVIRQTNTYLAAIGPALMGARATGIHAAGDLHGLPGLPGREAVQAIESTVAGDAFMVTYLRGDGVRLVFVVRAPGGAEEAADVTLQLTEGRTAEDVATGEAVDAPIKLLPGQGRLLRIRAQ